MEAAPRAGTEGAAPAVPQETADEFDAAAQGVREIAKDPLTARHQILAMFDRTRN